ncbi:hypothetical protein VTJ49DRAFT_2945 [Mycothermus thermophilus]|uniref:Large ribosomal subunit protein mL50 n=1 Tax=Humicola insolens TaxID=85995 RepID=A0ABR3VAQ0_HUMIN
MRRLPRLPAPAPCLGPSQIPSIPLRAPAATITSAAAAPTPNPRMNDRRYLSTTPPNPARLKKPTYEFDLDLAPENAPETHTRRQPVPTQFRYPCGRRNAPNPAELDDATYRPAETADGLEEVGSIADWFEKPEHWGYPGGAAEYVRRAVGSFGPVEKVTDPVLLEVLVKRAIVEALVVARSAKGKSLETRAEVEQVFAHTADGVYRLRDIVAVDILPSGSEVATLEKAETTRVWDVLRGAVPSEAAGEKEGKKKRLLQRSLVPLVHARNLVSSPSWDNGWKKAVLRNTVAKFWAVKRIQQLTGHRIPDSKLIGDVTVGAILKMLEEPAKPPKLAELLEAKAAFQDLPNVRVFPRRVTPIDKDKMEGRWKIITRELQERELPIIGTGGYSGPFEKRWVEGK